MPFSNYKSRRRDAHQREGGNGTETGKERIDKAPQNPGGTGRRNRRKSQRTQLRPRLQSTNTQTGRKRENRGEELGKLGGIGPENQRPKKREQDRGKKPSKRNPEKHRKKPSTQSIKKDKRKQETQEAQRTNKDEGRRKQRGGARPREKQGKPTQKTGKQNKKNKEETGGTSKHRQNRKRRTIRRITRTKKGEGERRSADQVNNLFFLHYFV
jgi:hypothetical protein